MNNTISRIKQYIDYKGISVRKFEESLGFSNGSFASQFKNNKTIGVDKVENILHKYPDINPVWLLLGKGEMLESNTSHLDGKLSENKASEVITILNNNITLQNDIITSLKNTVDSLKETVESQKETINLLREQVENYKMGLEFARTNARTDAAHNIVVFSQKIKKATKNATSKQPKQ